MTRAEASKIQYRNSSEVNKTKKIKHKHKIKGIGLALSCVPEFNLKLEKLTFDSFDENQTEKK